MAGGKDTQGSLSYDPQMGCVSYLSHGCDQMSDTEHLMDGKVYLWQSKAVMDTSAEIENTAKRRRRKPFRKFKASVFIS